MRSLLVVLPALFCGLVLVGCSGEETSSEAETSSPDESATVAIDASGGQRVEVEVEIADDYAERQRGLMERTELAENAGMLFVFDREQQLSFCSPSPT